MPINPTPEQMKAMFEQWYANAQQQDPRIQQLKQLQQAAPQPMQQPAMGPGETDPLAQSPEETAKMEALMKQLGNKQQP